MLVAATPVTSAVILFPVTDKVAVAALSVLSIVSNAPTSDVVPETFLNVPVISHPPTAPASAVLH